MTFKISDLKFPQWPVNQNFIFDMTASWIDKTFFGLEYNPTPEKTMTVALCTNIFGLHRVYAGRKISAVIGWFLLLLTLVDRIYAEMLLCWLVIDLIRICLGNYGRVKSKQGFNLYELKALFSHKAHIKSKVISGGTSVLALALILIFAPTVESKRKNLVVSRSDLYVSQTDAAYKDLQELEAEIENKSSLIEEMNLYEQNREENQAQIKNLQREISDLAANKQELESELQELKNEIESKASLVEELENIEQTQADKSAELKSLKDEVASLKTDKENLEKDVTKLTDEKKTLSKETSDLSKEKEKLTGEIAKAKGKGYTLTAGVYVGGDDIPAGTYNINWVSGSGNVFVGYQVNEIFGSDSSWGYIKSYKNAEVKTGTRIEISGNVKVQFKAKD